MSYVELMEQKSKIAAARAELDEQEKELDRQIKRASYSYAQTLLNRISELGKQIEELGYHVMSVDFGDWIDFDGMDLDGREQNDNQFCLTHPGGRSQFIYILPIDKQSFICYTIITKNKGDKKWKSKLMMVLQCFPWKNIFV